MSHKKKHAHPVPPGNLPPTGPPAAAQPTEPAEPQKDGAPFQEQDEKRRIGDFTGAGEHSFHQPGGRNDANR